MKVPAVRIYLYWRTKRIAILEVACAWEPLVIVREKEKRGEVPGIRKGSGNAAPGVESVGLPTGGRGPGIVGRLQGGTREDLPPDQKGDLLPDAELQV